MMSGRVATMLAAVVLATIITSITARADNESEAALRHELEAVRHQLHELQLRVQRMETELDALQTSPSNAAAAPVSSAPAAPPVAAPSNGSTPPPAAAVPVETGAAPAPSTLAAPATAVPPPDIQPATAPPGAEAGTSVSPAAVPESFQWRETLKDQWRGIKAGMNGEEIKGLLGTPSREFTLDGKPVWYYSYPGIGNGSVMFSRDGHTVAGWQHPPFGFW